MKTAIILISATAHELAKTIQAELREQDSPTTIYYKGRLAGCEEIGTIGEATAQLFTENEALVFIGAMGICVRSIAPLVADKHSDPAVVCVDSTGRFVVPVLSGHIGGANELARLIATITGGQATVTTQSDNAGLWALDLLPEKYQWRCRLTPRRMNQAISLFVNAKPTALILEIDDEGTRELRQSLPEHVTPFASVKDFQRARQSFELVIVVSPRVFPKQIFGSATVLQYFPPVLHLGVGCQKMAPAAIAPQLIDELRTAGYSADSIATIGSIDIKQDEPMLAELLKLCPWAQLQIHTADELNKVKIPNPSDRVFAATGAYGVAEAAALIANGDSKLVIEKQKGKLTDADRIAHYTFALAMDQTAVKREGHIEIVGAGPGDPDLVSVKGRHFLQQADLILYAGSLVPRQLTECAKTGATVRSSASMNLEEQFQLMKRFYDQGKLVVRLHTGDPCIYGAIQEQMNFFDQHDMHYHITPGISSFQAAAAELRSQFTIPERVQTIILTRGEGRTPMPEREKLHLLARSQSTMCIFLSASIAEQVQQELLTCYPPETPVAACYRLTWKDQRIYRGQLKDLARIIADNNLTLTTMIVVGEAIDNRQGLSRLYSHEFTHLFREASNHPPKEI